jgi:hypothetical protein
MSGFLHQLANRSLGLAPQIRSRAALPYAPPAADFSLTEPAGHEAPPQSAAVEHTGHESPRSARDSVQAIDSTLPAPVVTEPAERAIRRDAEAPPPASPENHVSARQPPAETRLDVAPRSQAAPSVAKTSPRPLTFEPSAAPRPTEPVNDARHPADSRPSPLPDIESLVARLLGESQGQSDNAPENMPVPSILTTPRPSPNPAEITTIRPSAGRDRPAVAAEPASAPEVHITIGRLEVNPPNRPAPAAPPRPRGPAPLSLSDYLARRNGGRP